MILQVEVIKIANEFFITKDENEKKFEISKLLLIGLKN